MKFVQLPCNALGPDLDPRHCSHQTALEAKGKIPLLASSQDELYCLGASISLLFVFFWFVPFEYQPSDVPLPSEMQWV